MATTANQAAENSNMLQNRGGPMPRKTTTSPIPAALITQAFDELLPIIDEISDRFPSPGHPLAPPLLRLINLVGRTQLKLKLRRVN
jgi:hypothetical protein